MAPGQTVTVINKSGKVVSTGKHVVNVFKEAKSAYRERKAEIKAVRDIELEQKRAQKALDKLNIQDNHNPLQSSPSTTHHNRPPLDRGYSDGFYTNHRLPYPTSRRKSSLREESSPDGERLIRRHTTDLTKNMQPLAKSHPALETDIDMDLAYGDLPPPLPERPRSNEIELREKMSTLQQLLDEANCVQHSVIATIENLQKNPDALAAVALTLGEISTMAAKMAPGVLTSMKTAFPAIIALLASPQFMIAAGVGVGVTIIAFGGYKIIKRIQKRKDDDAAAAGDTQRQIGNNDDDETSVSEYDELYELDSHLSHIEVWRRGIADAEAQSLLVASSSSSPACSVEGEFFTPHAGRHLIAKGVLREQDLKSVRSSTKSKKNATTKSKKTKKESKGENASSSSSSSPAAAKDKSKSKSKKKEPSGLRMLFKTRA
jgi:hypothetical protein